MKAYLSFSEIINVSRPQIDAMERIGNSYPDANAPGACEAFAHQVKLVEGTVIQTYGVAAALARKADTLEEVAELWIEMGRFCQTALQVLAGLKPKYPECGAPRLYDLILDYKLAADKRYRGAMEEATCQTMELPKGLLPRLS